MAVVEAALTVAWWSLATGVVAAEEEDEDADVWAMLGWCVVGGVVWVPGVCAVGDEEWECGRG